MNQGEEEQQVIEIPEVMALIVSQDTEKLTSPEFAALYRTILLEGDVKRVAGYEKVKALFVEANGTQMSQATWEAFQALFHERFPRSNTAN